MNKRKPHAWYAQFYVNRVQGEASIGSVEQFPTKERAREAFNRMAQEIPGFQPVPSRPYSTMAIRNLLNRLAHRAGIGHVHPHSLRRACACHMLTSGADIRSIQVLLGHKNIRNTQIYTTLTAEELKKIHEKYHPHEQRWKTDGEKEEG